MQTNYSTLVALISLASTKAHLKIVDKEIAKLNQSK